MQYFKINDIQQLQSNNNQSVQETTRQNKAKRRNKEEYK